MEQRESEIFNEYVKIAEKEGLVKESDYAGSRIGTDTVSVIEALYGVRPNDEKKNQQYSQLLDQAHPETVVIAPAHDRLNGVLEDLKQRQSIMMGIALKTPDGALIQRRYVKAHQDLLDSLVRVGFTLDNEKQFELMKFADSCSERLVKESFDVKKDMSALVPAGTTLMLGKGIASGLARLAPLLLEGGGAEIAAAAGPIGWTLGGALAIISFINHSDFSVKDVITNSQEVLDELNDISDNPMYQHIYTAVSRLHDMASMIKPVQARMDSIGNIAKAGITNINDIKHLEEYIDLMREIQPQIPVWIEKLKNRPEPSSLPNWLQRGKDWLEDTIGSSDTSDVERALGALQEAIGSALKLMTSYLQQAQGLVPDIANNVKASASAIPAAPTAPATQPDETSGGEGELSSLVGRLVG